MLKRILGLLGWLGVALVFAAVAITFLKPEWQQYKNPLAIAGLVCTLLYILSQWREIAQSFSGRQARFGTLAVASILVVLAILVAINYLSTRHSKRWDLTNAKQFTLADQTKKLLAGLDKPVRVIVFAPAERFRTYHERLDEYASLNRNFQVEYLDPEKQPAMARPYEPLVAGGTIVFDYNKHVEKVNTDSEQDLTNALIKVTRGQQSKVYFVQGHEEIGEVIFAAPKRRRSDPAAGEGEQGQDHQGHGHVERRLMHVDVMFVVSLLAEEGKPYQTEHVERRKHRGEEADGVERLAARLGVIGGEQNCILREEGGERREASDSDGAKEHADEGNLDLLPEAAHMPHVLLASDGVNDTAG